MLSQLLRLQTLMFLLGFVRSSATLATFVSLPPHSGHASEARPGRALQKSKTAMSSWLKRWFIAGRKIAHAGRRTREKWDGIRKAHRRSQRERRVKRFWL